MKNFLFYDWTISIDESFKYFINENEFVILNIDNEVITVGHFNDKKLKLSPINYSTELILSEKYIELSLKVTDMYFPDVQESFKTTFLVDNNELDGLTNKEKVRYLINSSCAPICDTCLADALNIRPVNQINQICNKLKKENHLRREEELCPLCNKIKKCNRKFI